MGRWRKRFPGLRPGQRYRWEPLPRGGFSRIHSAVDGQDLKSQGQPQE